MEIYVNLFVALGIFFAHRALSIVNAPFADDLTIQYLYTLASSNKENYHNNILLPILQSQNREYERLFLLENTVETLDILIQTINDAKSQSEELKKKMIQILPAPCRQQPILTPRPTLTTIIMDINKR
ncbi:MAG: hypothetical protein EXX96DRAFT_382783 [Benjaminiella poitrasii]|nr:MAG: hypothetical protein EXX96DRAFT_382783 [Benjaminiella poitrasii]